MLNNELLEKLNQFIQYQGISLSAMESLSGTSKKNIISDIDQLNSALEDYEITIVINEERLIEITNLDFNFLMTSIFEDNNYYFQQERLDMMVLYLFLKQEFVSVQHFQNLFKMSKNSVLTDIISVNNKLNSNNLKIVYSRKDGYHFQGEDSDLRKQIDISISNILNFISGRWILDHIAQDWNLDLKVNQITDILYQFKDIKFVNERLESVVYLIAFLDLNPTSSINELQINQDEQEYLDHSKTSQISDEIIQNFPHLNQQRTYINIQLMSVVQGEMGANSNTYFERMLERIIVNVQSYVGSIFPNTETFRKNLYNHLVPSYFRMKFKIPLDNPLKSKIMEDFPSLFLLIKRSLKPISEELGFEISDEEVAYFAMHFGSYFPSTITELDNQVTAAIVCPHGVGTSIMIRNLLNSTMSEINFTKLSLNEVNQNNMDNIDFIISTVECESDKPVYNIPPSIGLTELSLLKRKIYDDFDITLKSIEQTNQVFNQLSSYIKQDDKEIVKTEIFKVLDKDLQSYTKATERNSNHLLTDGLIVQQDKVNDWQEAIRLASEPLLEYSYIQESYVEAMITTIEKYGPYIVLVPGVAVPHAKPADGSQKLGVSLLQLNEAVNFGNNDEKVPVKLVFVISIADNHSHLETLNSLNNVLEDEVTVQKIQNAKTKVEILDILLDFKERTTD
ncbi:BglG family transcription antiterminator [Aerococcaceae bacterium DSM 111022]|nr:BglG family transcription antiterminator [Aerococcaceae bacterium DSM 111022]